MVITSLQEKENRKFYVPIRPGNRGGWSLFEWQSVREMPYRDREMYLGNSAVIGVLDKGGKWRKRDWYLKSDKKYGQGDSKSEQEQAIRKDEQRMKVALGISEFDDEEKMTEEDMKEIMKRLKMKKQGQQFEDAVGLGFDKTKVQIRAKPGINNDGVSRLEGVDELEEYEKKQKKAKKQRKQKKHKKHKHREYSRSRSRSREKEKKHKQKKHKDKHRQEKRHKKHRRHESDSD